MTHAGSFAVRTSHRPCLALPLFELPCLLDSDSQSEPRKYTYTISLLSRYGSSGLVVDFQVLCHPPPWQKAKVLLAGMMLPTVPTNR